jgi:hypothetical protein
VWWPARIVNGFSRWLSRYSAERGAASENLYPLTITVPVMVAVQR